MKSVIACILVSTFAIFALCSLAAVAGETSLTIARHVEAIGSVQPAGDPQPADEEEAYTAALRNVVLEWAKNQISLGDAVQRTLKAEVAKADLPTLHLLFANPQVIYRKKRTGYCEIKVSVDLRTAELERWVAQFRPPENAAIKKLRVAVCIPEYHIQRPIPDPAGETELVRLMIKEGFRMVDQRQVEKIRYKDGVKHWKDDPKELLAIAQSWGADILIVGEAFSQDVANPIPGGLAACRARIEAKAIQCDTGEILASDDGDGGHTDLSPAVAAKGAIRAAANKLANKLIATLLVSHSDSPSQSRVQVVLLGVDFDRKSQFLDLLEQMKGVVSGVEETSFVEPRAELQVATSLSAGELARKVSQLTKSKGVTLKVVEQSSRRLVLQYPLENTALQP